MLKFGLPALWALPALCFAVVAVLVFTEIMGRDIVFSFHPLLMSAAFMLCFSYGIITYRMEVLEAQKDELGVQKAMDTLRNNHRIWQIGGSVSAGLGLIAIVISKIVKGHSLFVIPSMHASVGFLALLGVVVQGIVGYMKMNSIKEKGEKIHRWHGHLGYVTLGLGLLAAMLGASELWSGEAEFWIVSTAAVVLGVFVLILRLAVQYPVDSTTYSEVI